MEVWFRSFSFPNGVICRFQGTVNLPGCFFPRSHEKTLEDLTLTLHQQFLFGSVFVGGFGEVWSSQGILAKSLNVDIIYVIRTSSKKTCGLLRPS